MSISSPRRSLSWSGKLFARLKSQYRERRALRQQKKRASKQQGEKRQRAHASAWQKSNRRRIVQSLGRFLSIVLISAVGIGFFGGINGTGGAMLKSAEAVFSEQHLSDLRLISPLGFSEENIAKIRKLAPEAELQSQYFVDLYWQRQEVNAVVRFISLPPEGGQNQLILAEGRLPENESEIVVDLVAQRQYGLELGSTVTWQMPETATEGINLEDISEAFEEGDPHQSTPADGSLPSESKAPSKGAAPLVDPSPGIFSERAAARGHQGARRTLGQAPAVVAAGQKKEKSKDRLDIELPPALKELSELDLEQLESKFQGNELEPELREILELKSEDVLEDESDALIQLAKNLGDRSLKQPSYTVVGFVKSPVYLTYQRDVSSLGAGNVDFNAYLAPSQFKLQDPLMITLRYPTSEAYRPFSKAYKNFIRPKREAFSTLGNELLREKTAEIRQSLREKQELLRRAKEAQQSLLQRAEEQLRHLEELLQKARPELKELEAKMGEKIDSGEEELSAGKEEISEARRRYQDGLIKYQEAKTDYELKGLELKMAKAQLEFANQALTAVQEEINALQPLLAQIDADVNNLNLKITTLENIMLGVPYGMLGPDAIYNISIQCSSVDPALGDAVSSINPYDPSGGAQLRSMLASSISAARLLRAQSLALYNYHKQRLDSFFAKIAAAEAEVAQKQQEVANGEAAWQAGKEQLKAAKAELAAAAKKIEGGEKEIAAGEKELSRGKDKLTRGLVTASLNLERGETELAASKERFQVSQAESQRQMSLADDALAGAEQMLMELPSGWFVLDRFDNPGYTAFQGDVERISAVARVFPVFLFLVAALVCLTTMTRLIEEDRSEIGALKALGYDSRQIARRYLNYATLATLSGAILGAIFGPLLFPSAIMNSYSKLYESIDFKLDFDLRFVLIAAVLQLLFTLAATYAAIHVDLGETPAALLQPKAPKPGRRILLEHWPWLWNKLNFTRKLTSRNIFRYKARMAMIIAGISGCTALLFTAFGLHNSVYDMRDKQFKELWRMDGIAVLSQTGIQAGEEVLATLSQTAGMGRVLPVSSQAMVIEPKTEENGIEGLNAQSLTLLVTNDDARFRELFVLRDPRQKKDLPLPAEGLVLTQKAASEMGYEIGDQLTLKDTDGRRYRAPLTGIAENYIEHYAYMSPRAYARMSYRQAKFNTVYFNFDSSLDRAGREAAATAILDLPEVLAVKNLDQTKTEITKMISSIAAVILVLFLTAAVLAFVVLYNLANINITERSREIATFRVLGFQDLEVGFYIFRELTILTAISGLIGMALGLILHRFIISTMETEMIRFGQNVHAWSYLAAFALTMVFGQIVNFVMYFKIKKIDMVEALKGVE